MLDQLARLQRIRIEGNKGLAVDIAADMTGDQLAAGHRHTCALDDNHMVTCWGDDTYGQSSPEIDGPFESISARAWSSVGYYIHGEEGLECWGLCFVEGDDR